MAACRWLAAHRSQCMTCFVASGQACLPELKCEWVDWQGWPRDATVFTVSSCICAIAGVKQLQTCFVTCSVPITLCCDCVVARLEWHVGHLPILMTTCNVRYLSSCSNKQLNELMTLCILCMVCCCVVPGAASQIVHQIEGHVIVPSIDAGGAVVWFLLLVVCCRCCSRAQIDSCCSTVQLKLLLDIISRTSCVLRAHTAILLARLRSAQAEGCA